MTVSAWTYMGSPPATSGPASAVTLVEGACFAISSPNGDMEPGMTQGLFFRDTRFLSGWRMQINGAALEPLSVETPEPFAGTFITRAHPRGGQADSTLLVVRHRYVGNGMREDLVLRNLAAEPSACTVSIEVEADFAHLFEVKEGRPARRPPPSIEVTESGLRYWSDWSDRERELLLDVLGPVIASPGRLLMQIVVPARGEWRGSMHFSLSTDGVRATPEFATGIPVQYSAPAVRLHSWRRRTATVRSDDEVLEDVVAIAVEDLGALRIFDPALPNRAIVAAGSPWFMTVFGRDSLLTSWMTLLVDPTLAEGTLLTLAQLQGEKEDPLTEEQPGRILHEIRWGAPLFEGVGDVYYGTVDATPLFVMLLAELRRWGLGQEVVKSLLPNADRALQWIDHYGDLDGDGFVEYKRMTDRGLLHQGWKDSFDGISYASGRAAEPPIALCEVQGYTYAAYLGRAELADEAGDESTAEHYRRKAARLKEAFNERFWLEEHGWLAVGLGPDKRPIDSLTSNIGHCLWTGIVDREKAAEIARHLIDPNMFAGWGIRTLASSMGAYNPMSYQNGSVWPHDTAISAAGLMRYGFVEEAQKIISGLLDAADHFGGRLPELFCGFDRGEFAFPVAYPTSCSPQAWAAASVFCMVRTLLGLDPSIPRGELAVAPNLPPRIGNLRVENVPLADQRVTIEVSGDEVLVEDLPKGVRVVRTGPE